LPEDKRFTLEGALNGWIIRMDLRECVLDGFGSITDRDVW
jgi:hypothetical protein